MPSTGLRQKMVGLAPTRKNPSLWSGGVPLSLSLLAQDPLRFFGADITGPAVWRVLWGPWCQIDPFLSPFTKLKSKWIKDLHIKPDKLKLIEEKVGKSLEPMGTGEIFMNRTPTAYALRSTIDKWDLIKLQSFCKAKDIVNRKKWQPTDWKKIFKNPTSDRGLLLNMYKKLKKVDSKKIK